MSTLSNTEHENASYIVDYAGNHSPTRISESYDSRSGNMDTESYDSRSGHADTSSNVNVASASREDRTHSTVSGVSGASGASGTSSVKKGQRTPATA